MYETVPCIFDHNIFQTKHEIEKIILVTDSVDKISRILGNILFISDLSMSKTFKRTCNEGDISNIWL